MDPKPASPVVHPSAISFNDHFFAFNFSPQRHRGLREKFKDSQPDETEKQDSDF
jgi:hypothetical protein